MLTAYQESMRPRKHVGWRDRLLGKTICLGGLLYAILFPLKSLSQIGNPLTINYPPPVYHNDQFVTSPQNWGIVQDPLGRMLFANSDVMMLFDGKQWSTIEDTRNLQFRKAVVDVSGKVFLGGKEELGFLSSNALGKVVFSSLKDKIPQYAQPFGTILSLLSDDRGNVFFVSSNWLFVWNGTQMTSHYSGCGFQKPFLIDGNVLMREKGGDHFRYENDRLLRVGQTSPLDTMGIKAVYGFGAKRLWFTKNQGVFESSPLDTAHLPSALDSISVWNTIVLDNGEIAIATEAHGLAIFNRSKLSTLLFGQAEGLYTNSLIYPATDKEGGVWLATDIGLCRVEYPARLRKVVTPTVQRITALTMLKYQDALIVGSTEGCWKISSYGNKTSIARFKGADDVVRCMAAIGDELLVGVTTKSLLRLDKHGFTQSLAIGPTALLQSASRPGTWFLGFENGLATIDYHNGLASHLQEIAPIPHPVYELAELPNGDVWAAFDRVSRLQYPQGLDAPPLITTFDSAQGFSADHGDYDLFLYEGKLYFGTSRGLFSFDERQQKLVPDATFGERFADKGHAAHQMVEDLLGQIWLYDGERTGFLKKDLAGNWQWNDLPLRRMEDQTIWSIYPDPDSLIWIGTTTTLYCYDPRIPKDYHVPYHTLIDRVTVNDTQVVFFGNYADAKGLITAQQPEPYKPIFPFSHNDIAFSYTATSYESPDQTVYRHWLEGLEAGWAPWSPENATAYNGLPEGTYTFHVQAKNLYDTLGKEAAYTFTIVPPWYRRWWAYALYAAAGIGLVLLIVRWQVARANRKQDAAREVERQQQRDMLRVAVETQETERMRIALDLHDEVGAMLSTVKMSLKLSQRKLDKEGIDNTLEESTGLLDNAISSVREISHDLLPPSLESLGLATTVGQLAAKTARITGIPFNCAVQGSEQRLPIRSELTLYRVVQELITNSLKHSQATERSLDIVFEERMMRIRFRDNGVGVDLLALQASAQGLGLRGMASRIESLGGTLQLHSAPGQGFSAVITLPIPTAD